MLHTAQEAHDLMLQLKKEVDRLRGLAEDAHRRMRQSKKVADKLHNEFIFLLTRLGRELNKRQKYLQIDSYQNSTESWFESVKNEIIEFYEEEFESRNRTDINLPESADISLSTGKKECIVRIESISGGAIHGIGTKRSSRLSKILAAKYHIDFKIVMIKIYLLMI